MNKAYYVESDSYNPYKNLAIEEYLLDIADEKTGILYLWQNKSTVVIGRNQHSFKECNVKKLSDDGGFLARRLSGGGAVYHDLGNLNFTFVMSKKNYDLHKQMGVILNAVNMLGIKAEASGRNDVVIDGKKFSGNAFYNGKKSSYHHGTILINENMQKLAEYLNVEPQKLKSKGIESIKSRVTNLNEYMPEINVERMKECMRKAYESDYGVSLRPLNVSSVEIAAIQEKYASDQWRYGCELNSNYSVSQRFSWGGIELTFKVENGKIRKCAVYSDAMEVDFVAGLAEKLLNIKFDKDSIIQALENTDSDKVSKQITDDICTLF